MALNFGGEGEIRTLEQCYPLHDFQSCALDQLGDFSMVVVQYYIVASFKALVLYHAFFEKSIPYGKIIQIFYKIFTPSLPPR